MLVWFPSDRDLEHDRARIYHSGPVNIGFRAGRRIVEDSKVIWFSGTRTVLTIIPPHTRPLYPSSLIAKLPLRASTENR